MSVSFSALQIIGIVGGISCLLIVFLRLQRSYNDWLNMLILFPTGIALTTVSAFPDITQFIADSLDLHQFPGYRLILLLILAVAVIWLFMILQISQSARQAREIQEIRIALAASEFLRNIKARPEEDTVLVVLPAYNEAENVGDVLKSIPSHIAGHPIQPLVIDDGSADQTANAAKSAGAWVVSLPFRGGGGIAIRTGYRIARELGAKYVVTMDADGQHSATDMEKLVMPLIENRADFVIGSRPIGEGNHDSKIRYLGILAFSYLVSVLMRQTITDCSSGFRAFNANRLSELKLHTTQYHTAETIVISIKQGLRLLEVPIVIRPRFSGQSKKGPEAFYAFSFMGALVRAWLR